MVAVDTLVHGDAIEAMSQMPDASVDLVLVDPPYGTTKAKWDEVIPLRDMWEQVRRLRKPGAPVVIFATQPFTSVLIASNLKEFKYAWVWDKQTSVGHLVAKKRPMQGTEDIVVFAKGAHNYFPQMEDRLRPVRGKEGRRSELVGGASKGFEKVYDQKYPRNVLNFKGVPRGQRLHSTQKPVPLLEYLIKTYTQPGDTVLDFAMGSGSTGVAARNLDRIFWGIEKDKDTSDAARQRLLELC